MLIIPQYSYISVYALLGIVSHKELYCFIFYFPYIMTLVQ